MNIKWRLPLYSYKEKYDCAFHAVDVIAENDNLSIIHVERVMSMRENAEDKTEKYFSGIYGVNTFMLSFEDGKIIGHNQFETKICPDVLKPKRLEGKIYPDSKHYFFDKYDVFMESDWTVCCQERNRRHVIWKKNVRHYLYTEIECRDGILYFGTQGNGGLFYALSIADGNALFALANSHPEFFWVNGNPLIADPKGNWNLVNSKTGERIASAFCGDIKYRNGNDFIVLCEKYNRSARLYDAELLCAGL